MYIFAYKISKNTPHGEGATYLEPLGAPGWNLVGTFVPTPKNNGLVPLFVVHAVL